MTLSTVLPLPEPRPQLVPPCVPGKIPKGSRASKSSGRRIFVKRRRTSLPRHLKRSFGTTHVKIRQSKTPSWNPAQTCQCSSRPRGLPSQPALRCFPPSSEISLPPFSAPAYSSATKFLKCATGLAFSIGIPDPVVTLASDFGDSQVVLVSALALSARAFSDSVDSTFHKLFEFVSWGVIAGSAIELPCATAFELALAFAGQITPAGHPWNLPSTSEIDWSPPIEPHDMSIAAGRGRIKALTRRG
jgi:hypothetical protein